MIEGVQRVVSRMQAIEAMGRPAPTIPTTSAAPEATFAGVLQTLLSETNRPTLSSYPAAGSTWATPRSASTGFVPPELAAYGNGRIPADALVSIGQGEHRMWAPAALSFRSMASDAAAAGVQLRVSDSYRSLDRQYELADQLGLYRDGGLAAVPGTSEHGWGLSLDLDMDPATTAWMQANGPRYGFVADVPGEPWHWTYRGTAG
ncbi:MAG: D-alanyl-D-alanine carboxypeptidase family protein [Acidimicrobiales bacterium]|nr:D-alanyl-D-alanine carboxypeptidase family protein [Acidimicrobiales bacterium]